MALGNSMGLSSVTSVELTSTSVAPASMDWSRLEGRTISQPLDHAAPSSRRGSAFDADRIGELTFDSALALVERQAADPNSDQVSGDRNGVPLPGAEQAVRRDRLAEQQRAFMALSAILRAEPGHVADLVSVIRRDTPARDTLISILGAAGGAQPQAALIALVDDAQYASPPRGAAALALSRIDEPTAEAVRALADLAAHPTLREYGLFGLGTLSRRVRGAGDVKLADQAGALLMGQLASATDTADRVRVLRGLANAGLAAALPELQALVSKSEDEAVRGAAIEAMRLIADPAVDDALAQFLATEDRGLRTAALRAADRRESTLVLARALEVVALTAKRAHERSAAVKVLGEWRADLPELRTTLERVAKTDSESRIRAAAQGFLSD